MSTEYTSTTSYPITSATARALQSTATHDLLEQTAERAIAYLAGLDARAVAPTAGAVARLGAFDEPLRSLGGYRARPRFRGHWHAAGRLMPPTRING